jgi:hypothetical protein
LAADLGGTAAIGLGRRGEAACTVCVVRLGELAQVWHEGLLRGSWAAGEPVRVALETNPARGTVRISLDGVWLDEVHVAGRDFADLVARSWVADVGGRVARAVVSVDRH